MARVRADGNVKAARGLADGVRTAECYRDVLGFNIASYWGTPPVFTFVRRDKVELFFNR